MEATGYTIFNKSDLKLLGNHFMSTLQHMYETLTAGSLQQLISCLKLILVVLDTPRLAQELNGFFEISLTSLLQILQNKANMWKMHGCQQLKELVSLLLEDLREKLQDKLPKFEKPSNFQLTPMTFFPEALNEPTLSKLKLLVIFLRIHLIYCTRNKRPIDIAWLQTVEALIVKFREVSDLNLADSILTIVSWLCQHNKDIKKQCLEHGLPFMLLPFINNKNASISFKKKCLKFIKLLIENSQNSQRTLLTDSDFEKRCADCLKIDPFNNYEKHMHPLLRLMLNLQEEHMLRERIARIKTIEAPNLEKLIEILLYFPILTPNNSKLIKEIARMGVSLADGKESATVAICMKILENYINSAQQSEFLTEIMNQLLTIVLKTLSNQTVERSLLYANLKSLSSLLKKQHTRQHFIKMSKVLNLKDRLPKEFLAKDVSMMLLIDRVQHSLTEPTVQNVLTVKTDKAQQALEQLQFIKQFHENTIFEYDIMEKLLNFLPQSSTIMPSDSKEEEVNEQIKAVANESINILHKAAQMSLFTSYEAEIPNKLITSMEYMPEKEQTIKIMEILGKMIPACPNQQDIKTAELVTLIDRSKEEEVIKVATKILGVLKSDNCLSPLFKKKINVAEGQQLEDTKILEMFDKKDNILGLLEYLEKNPPKKQHEIQQHLIRMLNDKEAQVVAPNVYNILEQCSLEYSDELLKVATTNPKALKFLRGLPDIPHEAMKASAEILPTAQNPIPYLELLISSLKAKPDYEQFQKLQIPAILNNLQTTSKLLPQLVGKSCHQKSIQKKYTLLKSFIDRLKKEDLEPQSFQALMHAICGLIHQNPQNQLLILEQNIFQALHKEQYEKSDELLDLYCEFDLKLPAIIQMFEKEKIIPKLIVIIQRQTNSQSRAILEKNVKNLKNVIKTLENASVNLFESSREIIELGYVQHLGPLKELLKQSNSFDNLSHSLNVVANSLGHQRASALTLCQQTVKEGCLQTCIEFMKEFHMNIDIIKAGLQLIEVIVRKMQKQSNNVTEGLNLALKSHCWNDKILLLVIKIIERLNIQEVLKQHVPQHLNEAMSQHLENQEIKEKFLKLLILMLQCKKKFEFLPSGLLGCLVTGLKITKNTEITLELFKQASELAELGSTSPAMNRQICQKTICLLQNQTKSSEKITEKGIALLFQLVNDIQIEQTSCRPFIQFSSYFLTRSRQIVYDTYDQRIRDFFCLLVVMLSQSSMLRMQMNDQIFLSILENWQKISKVVEVTGLKEALRMCFLLILQSQKTNISQASGNVTESRHKLEKGYHCYLYRVDQTSKEAWIQLKDNELQAYKLPTGDVKEKYRLPVGRIRLIVGSYKTNDSLYEKSLFSKAGGLFKRQPKIGNCSTIGGIDYGNPKFFDVQFDNSSDKQSFILALRCVQKHFMEQNSM